MSVYQLYPISQSDQVLFWWAYIGHHAPIVLVRALSTFFIFQYFHMQAEGGLGPTAGQPTLGM